MFAKKIDQIIVMILCEPNTAEANHTHFIKGRVVEGRVRYFVVYTVKPRELQITLKLHKLAISLQMSSSQVDT